MYSISSHFKNVLLILFLCIYIGIWILLWKAGSKILVICLGRMCSSMSEVGQLDILNIWIKRATMLLSRNGFRIIYCEIKADEN